MEKDESEKSYICPRPSLSFSIMTPRDLAVSLAQIQGVRCATQKRTRPIFA